MYDYLKLPCVGLPQARINSVNLPTVGKRKDDAGMKDAIRKSMIAWYSPSKEGVTNESLAVNPYLKNLVAKDSDAADTRLLLYNIPASGKLSGIGSYIPYFENIGKNAIYTLSATPYKIIIKAANPKDTINETAWLNDLYRKRTFKVKVSNLDSAISQYPNIYLQLGRNTNIIYKDGEYNYIPSDNINDKKDFISVKGLSTNTNHTLNIEIEVLPDFPDSLVFNGFSPTYIVNKESINYIKTGYASWDKYNVCHINKQARGVGSIYHKITGNENEVLTVSQSSFKVRIKGLQADNYVGFQTWDTENGYQNNYKCSQDGTFVVPAVELTVNPTEDNPTPTARIYEMFTGQSGDCDITVEFLPTYPAPAASVMYGQINNLPENSVACMMMDVTPFGDQTENWMFSNRLNNAGFSICRYGNTVDNTSTSIAYSIKNNNGTYIDGELNKTKTPLDLLQLPQVIGVNCSEPPLSTTVYLTYDLSNARVDTAPQMALRSLILFDRVLTEEEMQWVMKNLMGFKKTTEE